MKNMMKQLQINSNKHNLKTFIYVLFDNNHNNSEVVTNNYYLAVVV